MSANDGRYNWEKSFTVDFDMVNGLSKTAISTKRYLSQMKNMYYDTAAAEKMVEEGDPVIYEFYELGTPAHPGNLAFGTSITYPGKVGNEYFMTKGHFHTILDTSEVYFTLQGKGFMLMENPEGDVRLETLQPGVALYVPRRYAHRTINAGNVPLITFFTFRGDAGHDYGTIETKGYRKLLVEQGGFPRMIDNPRWK